MFTRSQRITIITNLDFWSVLMESKHSNCHLQKFSTVKILHYELVDKTQQIFKK